MGLRVYKKMSWPLIISGAVLLVSACLVPPPGTGTPFNGTATAEPTATAAASATVPPTSTPGTTVENVTDVKYLLLSKYELFYCDPYAYPVARPDAEQQAAIDQFPTLQSNTDEFNAILQHLGLQNTTSFTDNQKLQIFREHNRLDGVTVFPSGDSYQFDMRVTESDGGHAVTGTVSASGEISVDTDEQSINTCPICLVAGTAISTPTGDIPVEAITTGTVVWTIDSGGNRIAAPVVETVTRPVSPGAKVVSIELADGRSLTASLAHPTADGRPLAAIRVGDSIDGSEVVSVKWLPFDGPATYDLLPAGGTGVYWANGILLGSTMAQVPTS